MKSVFTYVEKQFEKYPEMGEVELYTEIFYRMKDRATANINSCSSVLFLEHDKICYRKVFTVGEFAVSNKYGFDEYISKVIPYDEDPEKLKVDLAQFVAKLINNLKREYKMNVVDKMIEVNKDSAINTAKIELGKSANQLVLSKLKPKLPMLARGYADSPLAELVVGNIVAGLLLQFAKDNKKAEILAEAMISAGAQVAIESFDIPSLIAELLENVTIPVEEK